MKPLIVISSGKAEFREYALASMATRSQIILVDFQEPAWVARYVHAFHLLASPVNPAQMLEIIKQLVRQEQATGVVTYDDRYVVSAARAAEELGLPGAGLQATIACKDKWETRKRLAAPEVGGVKAQLVGSQDEAVAAATAIGLPVVLKPRALGGSIGVIRVDHLEDIRTAFEVAASGSVPNLIDSIPGVLVEECIDGEEFSIDSLVYNGRVYPLFVAVKLVGLTPYFEELGHVVTSEGLRRLPGIQDFLQAVHEVLGFHTGATHTEIRVTQQGYKIMEVNARLGGDLIPYLGFLATGIDLAGAVADIAQGRKPDLSQTRGEAAAIRFIYPERDMTLQSVTIPEEVFEDPNVVSVRTLIPPGTHLRMPPKGYLTRVVMVITKGEDAKSCLNTMERVVNRIAISGMPN